ncbi:LacI family DNA-binding transcriptional regulator [Pseudoruegeria sp. HB172150]|uniref:LacI family DNA-binding transcriptional regulator n=1 Tax=Pseudoruegeria sp. HB172150 TaxID=2721164 RepID=UPI001557C9AF|nr:LacI family DNA-binding transcriptional regulator [Pseudoruegeria sp. HB172150]
MVKKAKPTIYTVAEDAGVSIAAVSKVLRDAYGVSDVLRERVQASIDKLGYRPRTSARGLRGRTYALGTVISDMRNTFLPDIMEGMRAGLANTPYRNLIGVSNRSTDTETQVLESMIDHNMDGVILVAPQMPASTIERFANIIPTVVIGHHTRQQASYDTVNADDESGAKLVVEHCVSRGLRDIVMFSGKTPNQETSVITQRETGYRDAMETHGLTDKVRIVRAAELGGALHGEQLDLLLKEPLTEAVFCWSDQLAIRLLAALEERKLRVPTDISVVGFDNSSTAALPQISLTSVDQSGIGLGKAAIELMLDRIAGRAEAEHRLLDVALVGRRTA